MEECIKGKRLFVFKYLDFSFGLSSGERAFLNIFSSINAVQYLKFINPNLIDNIYDDVLLFLDEHVELISDGIS